MDKCHGCMYHEEYTAVCVNADCKHCADYRHSGCISYKSEADAEYLAKIDRAIAQRAAGTMQEHELIEV